MSDPTAMTDAPFSLGPWPIGDKEPKTISEFIARLNNERGGFRNITEASLREEIKAEQDRAAAPPELDDGDNVDADAPDDEDDIKALQTAREDMLRNIEIANFQITTLLDCVSLLLTKEEPTTASTTLTTSLREYVGIGCLGADKVESTTLAKTYDTVHVSTGFKGMDCETAIDSLQAAAERLQNEIKLEMRYWSDVVRAKENNWALSKVPRQVHNLGVKFGFKESTRQFNATSLATLKRDDDGKVDLGAPGMGMNLRVRLVLERDGQVVGRSVLPQATPEDGPLEERVLEARNTILAKELWYELNREARTLLAYNVLEHDGILSCSAPGSDVKMLLTLETLGSVTSDPPLPGDALAESMSISLQMLLRHFHGENYNRRFNRKNLSGQRVPAEVRPMNPNQNRPYNLIRPLIAHAIHEGSSAQILSFASGLAGALRRAGFLEASFSVDVLKPVHLADSEVARRTIEASLLGMKSFDLALSLTAETRVLIRVRTVAQLPFTGTTYQIQLLPPPAFGASGATASGLAANPLFDLYPPGQADILYPNANEVIYYLRHAAERIIALRVEATLNPPNADNALPGQPSGQRWACDTLDHTVIRTEYPTRRQLRVHVVRPSDQSDLTVLGLSSFPVERKHSAAILLHVINPPDGKPRAWVWLPDGSGTTGTLEDVVATCR